MEGSFSPRITRPLRALSQDPSDQLAQLRHLLFGEGSGRWCLRGRWLQLPENLAELLGGGAGRLPPQTLVDPYALT